MYVCIIITEKHFHYWKKIKINAGDNKEAKSNNVSNDLDVEQKLQTTLLVLLKTIQEQTASNNSVCEIDISKYAKHPHCVVD